MDRLLLFDVFGTLVRYQPDRARLDYPVTHALAVEWGSPLSRSAFVAEWDAASARLEAASRRTMREFDMGDAARAFATATGLELTDDQVARLGASFVAEWSTHLVPVDGVADMVGRLAEVWTIGIVSNTHDPTMVPTLLAGMGLAAPAVLVLSVDHGWCKPHPSIYTEALDRAGIGPDRTVFVGDSFDADYAGPEAMGIRSYLIDPDRRHPVPDERRLRTILDLEAAVAELVPDRPHP
ncbi:MAG: HAD family hydrolase [Actinomycetota bacterium]